MVQDATATKTPLAQKLFILKLKLAKVLTEMAADDFQDSVWARTKVPATMKLHIQMLHKNAQQI